MFKFVLAALSALSLQAFANDGGIAVVDVLGIAPGSMNKEIAVYGGDTKDLFDVMPITFVFPEEWKSLYFASPKYAASISCQRDYNRPTNGEARSDYLCTFKVQPRSETDVDLEDANPFRPEVSDFTAYNGGSFVSVLGIAPQVTNATLFTFYGGNAAYFAQRLPAKVTFSSARYRVQLACQKNYKRPSNGELRSDYMCSLSVQPK